MRIKKERKPVYGWGINDVDYATRKREQLPKLNGKRNQKLVWTCPYYADCMAMIDRCFSGKSPTYKDCTICEDWKYLSNFIKWVDSQPNRDWQNCALDKDLLIEGNKHYSPDTCVYIPEKVNSFITKKSKNELMVGVFYSGRKINIYRSYCNNPFTRKCEFVGLFPTELEAHLAWKAKKHEHACKLADLQSDQRVVNRLREMYSPETDWTNK